MTKAFGNVVGPEVEPCRLAMLVSCTNKIKKLNLSSLDFDYCDVFSGATSPLEQRGSTTAIPEELTLDYAEITSIPPLPLWTLLAADKETASKTAQNSEDQQDYNDLFDGRLSMEDESLDDYLQEETDNVRRMERRQSGNIERQGLSHFGPRQVKSFWEKYFF